MPKAFRSFAALALLATVAGCTGAQNIAVQPGPLYEPVAPLRPVVAYGSSCYAGVYRCQLSVSTPIGSQCSCPGLGAPSYGVVE